jgi:hypothetical protein
MAIEEIPAADLLPSDEAIERAEQKLAALQSVKYFERRLADLTDFYNGERARLQSRIDESRATYRRLSARGALPA